MRKSKLHLLPLSSKRVLVSTSLIMLLSGSAWAVSSQETVENGDAITAVPQQHRTIKGIVKDANGEPIIGANVIVKGNKTIGVITNLNGEFSLEVPSNATLQISYIGYLNKEVKVSGNQVSFNIQLEEDSKTLDEVVVVGYGTQKKANLTGAVSSVDFEEQTKSRPITTVSSALAGLSPGLQASSGSAMPGEDNTTLRVRGNGTMNNASPLIIIDGMEGSLNAINPQDIENISILKDAASCAIYGARAANGVILVTTKSGDRDKIQVNYSGRVSFNSPTRMIETMSNYADYMELMNESCENVGSGTLFDQKYIDLWREKSKDPNGVNENGVPNYIAYPNTNWLKELYSGGMIHEHNLSVSGGSNKIRFLLSARYQDNEGIVDNTANKTYSVRANIEANPTQWLTLGTRTYASQMDREVGDFSNANTFLRQSTAGTYPEWNGSFGYPECPDERATANNPLYKLARNDGFKRYNRFNTTLFSKVKFFKDLSWDFNFNYNRYIYETRQWGVPAYQTRFSDGVIVDGITPPSQLSTSFGYESNYSYTLENLLNYHHTFAQKHDVSALLGYQEFYKNYYTVDAAKKGLIDESLNQFDEATEMTSTKGATQDYATRSVFGRVNYAYNSRYLFEANFRYDGSSRFHKDHRWGTFWSIGGNWRISKEAFMEDVKWIDNLSLKLSYGQQGNDNILNSDKTSNYYLWQSLYDLDWPNSNQIGGMVSSLENQVVSWEKNGNLNVGVEATFLGSRLSVNAEYYNRKTVDMLLSYPMATSTGFNGYNANVGDMRNSGFEFEIRGTAIRTDDFVWNISWMGSTVKNKVLKLTNTAPEIIKGVYSIKEGMPINTFYMAKSAGVDPATGAQLYWVYDKDENGNIINERISDDYSKASTSKYYQGNRIPDLYGSIGTDFSYKGFDLSVLTSYSIGGKIYDSLYTGSMNAQYATNTWNKHQLRRWQKPGDITDVPRVEINGAYTTTDRFLINASYFAIKNITLGYSLPKDWMRKAKLGNVRVFGSIDNLALFSHLKGMDPQYNFKGETDYSYTPNKTYSFGVEINF